MSYRIAIGADHAGIELKTLIFNKLTELGHSLSDFGASPGILRADYPLVAKKVAGAVAGKEFDFGILICGTGIGMSIAANRTPGVRAANCGNEISARFSRAHNDANILTLGARIIGPELALAIVESFFSTAFQGGRHEERLNMIDPQEQGLQ